MKLLEQFRAGRQDLVALSAKYPPEQMSSHFLVKLSAKKSGTEGHWRRQVQVELSEKR